MSKATSLNLQIQPFERFFENRKWDSDEADLQVLAAAAELLGERTYPFEDGLVRVRLDWAPWIEWRRLDAERNAQSDPDADEPPEEAPPVDVTVSFVDERADADGRDLHPFLELFLHESFLMLNVAVPGSFGGRMRWSWGERREREVALDARVFETAWATSAIRDWPRIEPLPLADVKAWYDALGIGTQQVATTSTARTLFHLLYLARSEEEDMMSVLRLALALEAVFEARQSFLGPRIESILGPADSLGEDLRRFLDDREAMILGTAPVAHPMYDDSLDPRADDESFDYTEVVDFASRAIVGALQEQVRSRGRLRLLI
ncbi:MAG: hypothetical protein ABI779_07550 [Acidobacteriota bacterium]